MVVLTNEGRAFNQPMMVRSCKRCRQSKWQSQFPNVYAKRCRDCHDEIASAPCMNCGGPSGGTKEKRKFCDKPECEQARRLHVGRTTSESVHQRLAARTHKTCSGCGEEKRETIEFFGVSKRAPDGSVYRFAPYCRECVKGEARDRYHLRARDAAVIAERRRKREVRRERELARRAVDPEYEQRLLAQRAKWQRDHYRKKKVAAQPKPPSSGTGPNIIAWPLMDKIDEFMAREQLSQDEAAARLGTTSRRFREWHKADKVTRMSIAEECLKGLDLLWYEVWPPVWFPTVAAIWEAD
jgi:hypothetical protein